jgi:hypothetical protein
MKWLEERGCYVEKPCLEPGDFIVWDSRTVHWGAAPEEQNHRMAVCELMALSLAHIATHPTEYSC